MEPANIDWKKVDSHYEKDELYEHINAPKWLDLSAPDSLPVNDDAWFCRPDCRHPKTAEDFQKQTPSPKVKPKTPLGERKTNHRDANNLKRRGGIAALLPPSSLRESPKPKANATKKFREDVENQDPNVSEDAGIGSTPTRSMAAPLGGKFAKEKVKSSAEKRGTEEKEEEEGWQDKKPLPRLKSTLSARNLFSGKDILSQISEFCQELKKMAVGKERAAAAKKEDKKEERKSLVEALKVESDINPISRRNDGGSIKKSSKLVVKVEREGEKGKRSGMDKASPVLREVRALPPTPQRFPSPSSRPLRTAKTTATTNSPLNRPPKCAVPGDQERGILQEVEQSREAKKPLVAKNEEECKGVPIPSDSEGSALDMFWFLKPCTYLV